MPAGMILMFALATAPAAAAPVPAAKPASGPSAVPPELVTYCKTRKCRQNVNVVLRDATGKPMRMQRALMPPAVEADMVNVLPGEKVEFVAEFKDGKFGGWRLPTPKDGASAYRITVQLDQHANDPGMTARVSNSGPKGLKFSMGVVKAETGAHPEGVSSCPVTAKGSTNETWDFPIGSLLIRDARTLEATDKVGCE